jgi:hypothetical protein
MYKSRSDHVIRVVAVLHSPGLGRLLLLEIWAVNGLEIVRVGDDSGRHIVRMLGGTANLKTPTLRIHASSGAGGCQ